jgi:phosphate uptake regulator
MSILFIAATSVCGAETGAEDIDWLEMAKGRFESVGDVIETDLVGLSYRALDEDIETSKTMRRLVSELGDKLAQALGSTIKAVRDLDQVAAQEVLTAKADIDRLLDNLKRIHTQLKRIAREELPQEVRE